MTAHVFVDETKERGFYIAAAALLPAGLAAARQAINRLVLPGQRRLHFKHERDARRSQIIGVIAGLRRSSTTRHTPPTRRRRGGPV